MAALLFSLLCYCILACLSPWVSLANPGSVACRTESSSVGYLPEGALETTFTLASPIFLQLVGVGKALSTNRVGESASAH